MSDKELTPDINDDNFDKEVAQILERQDREEAGIPATDTDTETLTKNGSDTETETVSDGTEEHVGEPEAEEAEAEPEMETDYFRMYGLDKTYRDPSEALKALPYKEQEIQRLQWELAQARRSTQTQEKSPTPLAQIDPDEFVNDPAGALAKAGYVRTDQLDLLIQQNATQLVDSRFAEQRFNEFITQTPDFNELRPVMNRLLQENPGLEYIAPDKAAKTLYTLAKQEQAKYTKPKTKVEKADPAKKERAQTAGGKKGGGDNKRVVKRDALGYSPEDHEKMTLAEAIEKIGFGD